MLGDRLVVLKGSRKKERAMNAAATDLAKAYSAASENPMELLARLVNYLDANIVSESNRGNKVVLLRSKREFAPNVFDPSPQIV